MNKSLSSEEEKGNAQVLYVPVENRTLEEDEISLLDIIKIVAAYRFFIFLITSFAVLGAAVYAYTSEPLYKAEALLAPSQKESKGGLSALGGQLGGLASMAGINLGSADNTDEAIAILKSRQFTQKFIDEQGLLPHLFADKWDSNKQQWYGHIKSPPDNWAAYSVFNSIRNISVDKRSNLVNLSIQWHDAEQAALWVNKLVTSLNSNLRQRTIDDAEKSISYLNKQLAETSVVELHQVIYRLIEGQIKNIMLASTREEFAFKIIDPAVAPKIPAKPNKKVIVVLSLVLGLFSSLMLAFLHHWWRSLKASL